MDRSNSQGAGHSAVFRSQAVIDARAMTTSFWDFE